MKEKIGKYKLIDTNEDLQVHYTYEIGDIISGLFYLLGFAVGLLLSYIAIIRFDLENLYDFNFWLLAIVGMGLTAYFLFLIVGGLYRPFLGIFQVDKENKVVIIRDLFKNERISIEEIASMFCELTSISKPKQKYGMMYVQTKSGEKKECFIIRSSIPFDLDRKIDKDILVTANSIKNRIYEAMKK